MAARSTADTTSPDGDGRRHITLPDGRRLDYSTWGDPTGTTIVLSGAGGVSNTTTLGWEVAGRLGVQIVHPDRPGTAGSSFQPGRTILDWPNDVDVLLSHLGLERVAVVGISAGTPYALAIALALADRVDALGVIAGAVPPELHDRQGLAALVKSDPEAARRAIEDDLNKAAADPPAAVRQLGDRQPPDGELYGRADIQAALLRAAEASYRAGTAGAAHDTFLRVSPWGFALAEVPLACRWWHGEADAVCPLSLVQQATAAMSSCALTVVPDAGHGINITHVEPFLRDLLQL